MSDRIRITIQYKSTCYAFLLEQEDFYEKIRSKFFLSKDQEFTLELKSGALIDDCSYLR